MTVYARSDITAVTISASAGGCGEIHARPTPNGAPVKLFAITCPGCEAVLRFDANWGGQPHEVPETPDETAIREDTEKRGQVEQAASIAQALKDLAKLGDLPAALVVAMTQFANGTQQPPAPVVEAAIPDVPAAEPEPEDAIPSANDIAHLSMGQLKNLAVKLGVPTTRSRTDQLKLLYEKLETVNC